MQLTGAEIVIECLKEQGVGYCLRLSRRHHSEHI